MEYKVTIRPLAASVKIVGLWQGSGVQRLANGLVWFRTTFAQGRRSRRKECSVQRSGCDVKT